MPDSNAMKFFRKSKASDDEATTSNRPERHHYTRLMDSTEQQPESPSDEMDSTQQQPESPNDETPSQNLAGRLRGVAGGNNSTAAPASAGNPTRSTSLTKAPIARLSNNAYRSVDREAAFVGEYVQKMTKSRPIKERIRAIQAAGLELESYSVDAILALLDTVDDLVSQTC